MLSLSVLRKEHGGPLAGQIRPAIDIIGGVVCPHQVESDNVGVLVLDVIAWRFAGHLFVLIPPVRTLAHLDPVAGTGVGLRLSAAALTLTQCLATGQRGFNQLSEVLGRIWFL